MRILAITALFLCASIPVAAQGVVSMRYEACPDTHHHDPSIISRTYSQQPALGCNGYRKIDAFVDAHLGVIYDMATPELSVGQEFVDPDTKDVAETMTACSHLTPLGKVIEWFVPNGEPCEGRPYTGFRLYSADGATVCIMNAVWCVPIAKLKPLGQARAQAAIERGNRARPLTMGQ